MIDTQCAYVTMVVAYIIVPKAYGNMPNKTEEGNYTMLENLNSYLDDPLVDGNRQDDEVE